MSAVFLKLLNLSITASWLILAVILVRFLLKKAPKWISCVLWALVAIRLICPFSLESALSLIPSSETIPSNIEMMQKPAIDSGITAINEAVNPAITHSFAPDPMTSANPLQIVIPVLSIVWIEGMAAMLLYALISYIRLKKSVGASVPVRGNILACDEVKSPFILGIIKPLIYVPSSMEGETLDYVITHESAHIQRRDHWWKPFGFLLLSVYWFNPLCWLAYVLLCRDIEMACDEKVIREFDNSDKAAYSQALLDCSFPRRRIAACPLAFGEIGVKERVKSVLDYKKPAFWIIVVAVVVCIAVAICFLTNPSDKSLSGKLGVSMDMAVAEYNHSPYSAGNFIASNCDVLRITKGKGQTTVYAWVYYAEYSYDGTDVKMESASHIPTAVTFDTSADGSDSSNYDVIEYWIPRDGNYYGKDIREKFPMLLWGKAFDVSGASLQKEKCWQAAREYYGVGDLRNVLNKTSATKWFDCLHGDEMIWDGRREINLDEFPGVTFRWFSEKLEAVTQKETITLYTGMPIWSVYFCDFNGDGKPELCSSTSFGSGLIDNRFIIYDYANGASYERSDRGQYDYTLNLQNGKLIVEKRGSMQEELAASGELVFRDETYQIIWDKSIEPCAVYLTDYPENEFTARIPKPANGTIDYVIDDSANGRYAVFFKDITMEQSEAYIKDLKAAGYTNVAGKKEDIAIGEMLQKDDVTLSVACSDGGLGIQIIIANIETFMGSVSVAGDVDGPKAVGIKTNETYYSLTDQGKLKVSGSTDSNHSFVQSQMLWTNSTKISVKNNSGTDVVIELFSNESDSTAIMEMQLKDKESKEFTNLSSQYVYFVMVSSESTTHISIDITE